VGRRCIPVIVFTPILVASQNQPSGTQERNNTQQANPATPVSVNCNCGTQTDDGKNKPQGWHKFVTWPEGIEVWALLGTLGVIAWQSCETRRATNSQRDKDRARLFVELSGNARHANFNQVFKSRELEDFYWSLGVKVTQHGSTKAFNVSGHATLIIRPNHEKRPIVSDKQMLRMSGIPGIIEEASSGTSQLPSEGFIEFVWVSDATLERIRTEDDCVHFFGWIQYEDVFGASRRTTFRYIWKPEIREPIPGEAGEMGGTFVAEEAGWEISGKPEDNRAS
jgi:hypothetical protein